MVGTQITAIGREFRVAPFEIFPGATVYKKRGGFLDGQVLEVRRVRRLLLRPFELGHIPLTREPPASSDVT